MKQNTVTALKKLIKEMVKKEVKRQLSNEVTAKNVHQAAEDAGMEWDDNKNFMAFSKRITGKEHIDLMTSSERSKLISAIKVELVENDTDYYTGPEPKNQQFAVDPVLNKILNETKGGIQGNAGTEPYPTMGGGVIDSQEKFFQQTGTAPIGISNDQPDFMKKAMSGHYKEVINKVEETRGTRHS